MKLPLIAASAMATLMPALAAWAAERVAVRIVAVTVIEAAAIDSVTDDASTPAEVATLDA